MDTQHGKITGSYDPQFRQAFFVGRTGWLPHDVNVGVPSPGLYRQKLDQTGITHARYGTDALQHRRVKIREHVAILVRAGREIDLGGENWRGIETQIGMLEASQRAEYQSRGDQQHQRQRDLHGHKRGAQMVLSAIHSAAASGTQGKCGGGARKPPRGPQPGNETGRD